MNDEINLSTVITRIQTLKSNGLIPRNWVKLIAQRNNVSPTIVREWAAGKKNSPDGAILVLENIQNLLDERKNKIKQLTSPDNTC